MPDPTRQPQHNLTSLQSQANDRAHLAAQRRIANLLGPKQPGRTNRQPERTEKWATVIAINAGPPAAVDLFMDGGTVTAIRYLASYTPTAGDTVIVAFNGSDSYVVGRLA